MAETAELGDFHEQLSRNAAIGIGKVCGIELVTVLCADPRGDARVKSVWKAFPSAAAYTHMRDSPLGAASIY